MVKVNSVYAAIIIDGKIVTLEPAEFSWSDKRDAWYNADFDLEIEWIGYVTGPVSYLSSRSYVEVQGWIAANS